MTPRASSGHHTCLMVDDIAVAALRLSESAGLAFEPVRTLCMEVESHGERRDVDVTFAYSVDRSIELLQAGRGTGIFGAEQGLGFHHYGVQAADPLEEVVERELAAQARIECVVRVAGKVIAVFFEPTDGRPFRYEVLAPGLAKPAT